MALANSRRCWMAGTAASLATIGYLSGPARAAQFEFRCASNEPVDHPVSVRMVQMWAAIERESGGRIRTRYFPNSILGGDPAMVSQLRLGALDFFTMNPGNLASVVPAADITYLGFAYKDAEEGLRVMDGPLGEYLRKETAAKGLYVLRTPWDAGLLVIGSTSHPIRVPDDLHGFKIRVPLGRISIDLFKTLGASPTPLSQADVYSALQTKLVDGQGSSMAVIETSGWYEVEKYISLTYHQWASIWLTANADVWKRIPPDLQAIVDRNNRKYSLLGRRDMRILNDSLANKLARQGPTVYPVDQTPFRARLKPYFEYWANEFGPTEWGLLQDSLGRTLI